MKEELDSLIVSALNSYIEGQVELINFVVNHEKVELARCKIKDDYMFQPSINPDDITREGVNRELTVVGLYNADVWIEHDTMSINGTPGERQLLAKFKVLICVNPSYKEGSHSGSSRDKYNVKIVEIVDNTIRINNSHIQIPSK